MDCYERGRGSCVHDAVMTAVREQGMDMFNVALEYIDAEGSALVL